MRETLKYTVSDWLWTPQKCTAERPAPRGYKYGWYCPSSQFIESHPTDPALARFICPNCGKDEYTYPTFQPGGRRRWRPGADDMY